MERSARVRRIAFFLALFCAVSLAATVSMLVPAVALEGGGQAGQNGQMIRMSLEARNGTGLVFVSTSPLVGPDTQSSARTAVAAGMSAAGRNASSYDVLISLDADKARTVDGPSAGAAMALLTISALTGKQIRGDFTITGTVGGDGSVGGVGGVPSKIEAAAKEGITVVAVPASSSIFDKILVASERERLGISVYEISSVSEAEALAFSQPGSSPELPPQRAGAPISGLPAYSYECAACGIGSFRQFSQGMLSGMDAAIAAAQSGGGDNSALIPYLQKSAADSHEMFDKGYYYTGANNAFLAYVDAKLLANAAATKDGLDALLSRVDACTDGLSRPEPTDSGVEFVAGGDMRATWARLKLSEVRSREENESSSQEGLLGLYEDALYAQGWCEIAQGLYDAASPLGGARVNESVLEAFAGSRVSGAREMVDRGLVSGSDAEWHALGAKTALESGYYFAAILDADYVLAFADAENASNLTAGQAGELGSGLASTKGSTLWSALFFAHSSFYSIADNDSGSHNTIAIGYIAKRFGEDAALAKEYLANPGGAPTAQATPQATSAPAWQGVSGLAGMDQETALVFLLAAMLVVTEAVNVVVFRAMERRLKETRGSRGPAGKAGRKPAAGKRGG